MSEPQKKKELSAQLRILLASVLSMAVIFLWARYFAPKPPVNTPGTASSSSAAPTTGAQPADMPAPTSSNPPAQTVKSAPAATAAATPAIEDVKERTLVIENESYRVEMSNRGGVVKSWQLKKYTDDAKPPRTLDVVHADASRQLGTWPFSVVLEDPQLEAAANGGLFRISSEASELRTPTELSFTWSNGQLEITKSFHFDHSYVVRVEASAKLNGAPIPVGVAWRGGFGDLTVTNPVPVEQVTIFSSQNGKLKNIPHKDLPPVDQAPRGAWQAGDEFAGIEDRYFAVVFLPVGGTNSTTIATRFWKQVREVQAGDKKELEPVAEVAATTGSQPVNLRVYVGPKDYDDLKKMNPPLHSLVQFGWLEFIADPLFHLLKWLHQYVHNWGWAIIVLTLLINILFFPLRIKGYRTAMKMQRVAPEIKQLQDKYKKYKMNDPKKAEMNKEMMAIYSREGINPVGGCIPQLLQMPIWFGLYRALQGTIELRHAPWFGWITDLSARDPFYILPVLMGVSMYVATKMTPMTTTDPQQQTMMKIMPIGMAGMFMVIPYPSGLAVYILTSNIVGVGFQWYLNRTHPAPAPEKPARGKKS